MLPSISILTAITLFILEKSGNHSLLSSLRCGGSHKSTFNENDNIAICYNNTGDGGEVVGASGRMGSLLLRQEGTSTLIAVPRGVSPGGLSPLNKPIYVTVPSKHWDQIYTETLCDRRDDLVWVGNGIPPPTLRNTTVVVPHYGVLGVGEDPVTSPLSPPTFVYGKHSAAVKSILAKYGIETTIVNSWNEICVVAAQKLLWASCMWLLCHYHNKKPVTVKTVHKAHEQLLDELVHELFPALLEEVKDVTGNETLGIVDEKDLAEYLRSYSLSMPNAIPNRKLAMEEIQERNGVWLKHRDKISQPLHEKLLVQVGGSDILLKALPVADLPMLQNNRREFDLPYSNLKLWGSVMSNHQMKRCRKAIVVGSGIIGSSVALNLARRGIVDVTVYDRLLPENETAANSNDATSLGATTPASWAWINANSKLPISYKWLNQMGMHAWKNDPTLKALPIWNGCLVRYSSRLERIGGYAVEGPLLPKRIEELEPYANFEDNDNVYFFPEEGNVNPTIAVQTLQKAGKQLGVNFFPNRKVTGLLKNELGHTIGVRLLNSTGELDQVGTNKEELADVVVLATGTGTSSLVDIPMLDRPGRIAFVKPSPSAPSPPSFLPHRLRHMVVDMITTSHVLQREDGTLVVGGGNVEVGGGGSPPSSSASSNSNYDKCRPAGADRLLSGAESLVPTIVAKSYLSHTAEANRPIPSDGMPAVGFISPGCYVVVTHSGVTLSPLLGAVVSGEIVANMECDLLGSFRPTRFTE